MNKIQKILVPVDFSESSAMGFQYAASLAKETKAELIVLHVVDKNWKDYRSSLFDHWATVEGWPTPTQPTLPLPIDRWIREKSLDLYNFVHTTIGDCSALPVMRRVEMGKPDRQIIQVAREERADLIVLAIKRRSLFFNVIARSILIKLSLRSPCPVLLTPPGSKDYSEPRGLLVWGWH
ncbi:MAG: universal stress protein [Deltaproteobacteria bacterium]|nr:universal stress protein [Deltaproteobacteria bacterium]